MQDGLPVDRAPGFEEPYASFHQAQREGSRHEASTGGGADSRKSKPPTHKFGLLPGFRPLYFGNIGKSKNSKYSEHFLKRFLGDVPPPEF